MPRSESDEKIREMKRRKLLNSPVPATSASLWKRYITGVARIEERGFKRQQLVVQCCLEVLCDVCTNPDIQISDQIGHTTLQYGKTDNEQWREPWR